MEAKATLNYTRISPRKVGLVLRSFFQTSAHDLCSFPVLTWRYGGER